MSGLDLGDLGLDVEEEAAPSWAASTTAAPSVPAEVPDRVSLRDAVLADPDARFQRVLANLGVREATACMAAAVHQIWGRRPDLRPIAATLMTVETEDRHPVDALADLLRLAFPGTIAPRVITLTVRHGDHFLDRHLAWQGDLADEGVDYEDMKRRAFFGEFDATGPRHSLFDIATMSFRDPTP